MDEYTVGDYLCPNCGSMEISDPSDVTISYPIGLDPPQAMIRCAGCDKVLISFIQWEDAIVFERRGANVEGFRFASAEVITEQEINSFVDNMDDEIEEFLDVASQ